MKAMFRPSSFGFKEGFAPIVAVVGLLGLSAPSANADYLIIVDPNNPLDVRFTSTGGKPSVSDATTQTDDGITLLNFFTAPLAGAATPVGDLRTRGLTFGYDRVGVDNASGSFVDLNFFVDFGNEPQVFDPTKPAFEGGSNLFLPSFANFLPGEGVFGDIIVGWSSSNAGAVIGQWLVIPEASTYVSGVMGLALVGWMVWQRRATSVPRA
ncbi:MAG: hypothetical protein ACKVYV_18385 [Limisphaerales bacterium]